MWIIFFHLVRIDSLLCCVDKHQRIFSYQLEEYDFFFLTFRSEKYFEKLSIIKEIVNLRENRARVLLSKKHTRCIEEFDSPDIKYKATFDFFAKYGCKLIVITWSTKNDQFKATFSNPCHQKIGLTLISDCFFKNSKEN